MVSFVLLCFCVWRASVLGEGEEAGSIFAVLLPPAPNKVHAVKRRDEAEVGDRGAEGGEVRRVVSLPVFKSI